MKLQSVILILTFVGLVACTREAPDMSRVSIHVPESASVSAKSLSLSSKIGALSVKSKWGQPAAQSFSEINCFAVMVTAPETSAEPNTCMDVNGAAFASPQFIQGGFLPDSDQSIEVPTGTNRTIYLVGFHTTSAANCTNLQTQKFSGLQFSQPVILAEATLDLKGGDVPVELSVPSSIAGLKTFEDCAPNAFSSDVGPQEPTAIIDSTGIPAINNLSSFSLPIGGAYTYQYRISLVNNGKGDCSDAIWNATYFQTPSIGVSVGQDGRWDFCVKATSIDGIEQSVPSRFSWVRDSQGPIAAPALSLAVSYGNNPTPIVSVTNVPADATEIRFYSASACSGIPVSTQSISADGTVTLSPQQPGYLMFWARFYDGTGNAGACTQYPLTYQLDTKPPDAPTSLSARYGTSLAVTPYFSWGNALDTGYSLGIGRYEVAVGSTPGGQEISPWMMAGTYSFYEILMSFQFFSNNSDYYFSVRAVDIAGNNGEIAIQKFRVNLSAQWQQQAYIKAGDAASGDNFGSSVSVDGDYMVVGSPNSDIAGVNSGSAYVYKRSGNDWAEAIRLQAVDGYPGDQFGYAVAISDDTIAVGAPYEDSNVQTINQAPQPITGSTNTSTANNGAVYIFRKNASGNWLPEAYIKPTAKKVDGNFGKAISLEKDTLMVGAPSTLDPATGAGAVWLYRRSGTTWTYAGVIYHNVIGELFGTAVSAFGNTMAIGAPANAGKGTVYIYRKGTNGWTRDDILVPPSPSTGDNFGSSLQLFNQTLVIGAPNEDSNQRLGSLTASTNDYSQESGAAYVYKNIGSDFILQRYLKSSNAMPGDRFGTSVAIWGTTVLVGAPGEDHCWSSAVYSGTAIDSSYYNCMDSGAVYVYQGSGGTQWEQNLEWGNYLKPTNTQNVSYEFGSAVAISGSAIGAGAKNESNDTRGVMNGPVSDANYSGSLQSSGALYLFEVYDAVPMEPIKWMPMSPWDVMYPQ